MVTRVTMQNYLSVLPQNRVTTFLQNVDSGIVFYDSEKDVFTTDVMPSEDLY